MKPPRKHAVILETITALFIFAGVAACWFGVLLLVKRSTEAVQGANAMWADTIPPGDQSAYTANVRASYGRFDRATSPGLEILREMNGTTGEPKLDRLEDMWGKVPTAPAPLLHPDTPPVWNGHHDVVLPDSNGTWVFCPEPEPRESIILKDSAEGTP